MSVTSLEEEAGTRKRRGRGVKAAKPAFAGQVAATKLFIATPTADGIALAGYVAALAELLIRLGGAGIAVIYRTIDGTDLIAARNALAQAFLDSDCTHLLFIDSDMTFAADLALRLLAADKPLIGTVYPKRSLDLAEWKGRAAALPFASALALSYRWNVRPLPEGFVVKAGLCRVEAVGGGFLMIRRDCLDRLLAASRAPRSRLADGSAAAPAFFAETREGDEIIDLDYSFCRAWIACGGEVWADATADIRHIGDGRHGAPFLAFLQAQAPPAQAAAPRP